MTAFTITGTAAGVPAQVTWTDGHVDGDQLLIAEAALHATRGTGVQIPGVWNGQAGVGEHLQALATFLMLFDDRPHVEGDEPDVEPLPEPADGQPRDDFDVVA